MPHIGDNYFQIFGVFHNSNGNWTPVLYSSFCMYHPSRMNGRKISSRPEKGRIMTPFSTAAVSYRGQTILEFECFVPQTVLQYKEGQTSPFSRGWKVKVLKGDSDATSVERTAMTARQKAGRFYRKWGKIYDQEAFANAWDHLAAPTARTTSKLFFPFFFFFLLRRFLAPGKQALNTAFFGGDWSFFCRSCMHACRVVHAK